MKDDIKNKIKQIVVSAILLIVCVFVTKKFELKIWQQFLIYLIPFLCAGFDVLKEALEGIEKKEIFDENFLMSIATIGAMVIGFLPNSKPEFNEAVFVMLFYQVGELFEIIAEGNSKKSIESLVKIRPDYANLVADGGTKKVSPEDVKIGDTIVIYPGERVPLDGVVIEGNTNLNTVALTGESVPRSVKKGDLIYSGCVNINGSVNVKVTKSFSESTASKIIDLVQNANEKKSNTDKFITRFAKIYTPVVVFLAIALAIIPSIITKDFITWINRALTFLVVSCPCALVISVPLTYFGGIGAAAKNGILIKGAKYLELLSKIGTIVFDKTGTLTQGVFDVVAVHPSLYDEEMLLHLATHAEAHSSHPIATSLKRAYEKIKDLNDGCNISDIEEIAGLGTKAKVNENTIYVGSAKLMDKINVTYKECEKVGTTIHIAADDKYLGHVVISDKIKDDSKIGIKKLKDLGIKTVMLTGDKEEIAKSVANELGIDKYYSELMPEDKVKIVEKIIENNSKNATNGNNVDINIKKATNGNNANSNIKKATNGNNANSNIIKATNEKIAFVGDGINDAPVIARCDVGIAMGGIGSDAAIEASDVVLMEDKVSKICDAISISRRTQKIAMENICFSLIVKLVILILALFGFAQMYLAVFADVGVTIIAVLNAMRAQLKT